ncbi:MAG: polyribonucleotide nucleotidyltransferase [Chloroflexota bacterium]
MECDLGGKPLIIETGLLAGQAGGAVTVRCGETVMLVTACASQEVREGIDFLPLTVDYEERLYAAGKIPGGFIRREGRPTQEATLSARLTDRSIRPLFPKGWHNETQVVVTVLSADQENDPDTLAIIGASAALYLSSIPFNSPLGAVHVGHIDGQLVVNPTMLQIETGQLDVVVSSTKEAIVMVEAGAREVSEELITQAIELGHRTNQTIIQLQEQLHRACGRPKVAVSPEEINPEIHEAMTPLLEERLARALTPTTKLAREEGLEALEEEVLTLAERFPEKEIKAAFQARVEAGMRDNILNKGQRPDGRGLTEIRPLSCQVGLLPRTHGSGMFVRGQTQVLTIATLGSTRQEQKLDGLGIEETKRFMHHYNFPPFSTGEVKRIGSTSRREIGHGALAERALLPVLPKVEDFPYTIRLVSEALSSNGSTSMASTCASSLSLMDAGVPIKAAVAGIAMGLITGENGQHVILTDIAGLEDHYGDMDFKVAGTREGITALQLDIKLTGIGLDIIGEALKQARQARFFILDKMQQTISASRPELSRYAPRVYKITIDPDKIGAVVGSGGKTIRAITDQTKTTIDISNDGTVLIGSVNEESAQKAIEIIEGLTKEVEIGTIYTGKVTRILNFGAMVEYLPGKEGLVHISELADHRVPSVEDVVKVGDEITVKAIDVDNLGRVNLSRRAVFDKEGASPAPSGSEPSRDHYPRPPRDSRPPQPARGRPPFRPRRGP